MFGSGNCWCSVLGAAESLTSETILTLINSGAAKTQQQEVRDEEKAGSQWTMFSVE